MFYTGHGPEGPGRVTGNELDNLIKKELAGHDFTINGLGGDDTIYGSVPNYSDEGGNDTVWAGDGNDVVDGRDANDNLFGQSGNDTLHGGEGLDRLYGGNDNDKFDYDAVAESKPGAAQRDVIADFADVSADDQIDLSTIDADTGLAGNQTFSFNGTDVITGPAQVRVAASGADTLIQANTGGTLAPELEIVVNDAAVLPDQWVAADFVL